MKTISKTSAEKKLAKLVSEKKLTKSSIVYGWINDLIAGRKEFRPVYTQGSTWKKSTLVDRKKELTTILKAIGIEFINGNDAPRGGKTGEFIRITTKVTK